MKLLANEIADLVGRYVNGRMTLNQFNVSFTGLTWNVDRVCDDRSTLDLAHGVELLTAEYLNGDWSEEELRERLRAVATPIISQ